MKKKFLKKQIKNIRVVWEGAMDSLKKYKDNYYDEEVAPKTSQPAWELAESLVEELIGLNLKKTQEQGWVNGEYLPETMIELILYGKGTVKDLLNMAEKVKANH